MDNIRILAFRKTSDMPNEIWATVELILKNTGLKFHIHHANKNQSEVIFMIDNKALGLEEVLIISQEIGQNFKINMFCYDPGRTSLTNKKLYPEPACQISLTLQHK